MDYIKGDAQSVTRSTKLIPLLVPSSDTKYRESKVFLLLQVENLKYIPHLIRYSYIVCSCTYG